MCSHVGATSLYGAAAGGDVGGGGSGEDSDCELGCVAEALCLEVRPQLRYVDPGGPESEARSAGVEQIARPTLPGRKVHSTARSEDYREMDRERAGERNRDGDRERDRERGTAEERNRERERDRDKGSAGERNRDHERDRDRERDSQRNRESETRDQERDKASDWDRNRDRDRERTLDREDRRGRPQSFPNSNANPLQTNTMEAPEGQGRLQKGLPSPGRPHASYQRSSTTLRSPRQASGSISPTLLRPSIRIRTSTLSPRRLSQRMDITETRCGMYTVREPGAFWVEPGIGIGRLSPRRRTRTRLFSHSSLELEEEEEEGEEEEEEEEEGGEAGGSGVMGVVTQTLTVPLSPGPAAMDRRMTKRERNRMKSLRKRQRRRARWRQSQLPENRQSSTGNPSSSSEEEDMSAGDREGFICAVCLDVYFSPYMCHPCNHIFCEPCLRTLAKNSPTNTPCPLCRTTITHVFFQKELNHTARTFFPKEYLSRKQTFQKASCAKWPLPSCRKLFRIFGGFQRQASPIARRQFPHGGYRLDAMDFEDNSRGWRFDIDMVIIYIYSVNWVIGFIIFCFLCYFFFPSF